MPSAASTGLEQAYQQRILSFLTRFIPLTFSLFNGFCFLNVFITFESFFFIFPRFFSVFRNYFLQRFLPERRYTSARTSYDNVSVCLSVTSRSSIETDERIGLIFGTGTSIDLSYTVL